MNGKIIPESAEKDHEEEPLPCVFQEAHALCVDLQWVMAHEPFQFWLDHFRLAAPDACSACNKTVQRWHGRFVDCSVRAWVEACIGTAQMGVDVAEFLRGHGLWTGSAPLAGVGVGCRRLLSWDCRLRIGLMYHAQGFARLSPTRCAHASPSVCPPLLLGDQHVGVNEAQQLRSVFP